MNNKIIQIIPAVLALLFIGFRYFSLWCTDIGHICYRTFLDQIFLGTINPLDSFARYFILAAVTLIFVSRTVFNSWFKLAVLVLPLLFIFVALTPVNWTGIGLNLFPFYRDDAARVAGGFFTVVSLLFIAWRYFSLRRSSQSKKARDASQT